MRLYGLALAALIAAHATAQPLTPAELSKVDQIVTTAITADNVPSASIAIVRDGQIVLAKAYGKANEGLPARPDQPYQIASNSKQFTAMALNRRLTDAIFSGAPRVILARAHGEMIEAHLRNMNQGEPLALSYRLAAIHLAEAQIALVENWLRGRAYCETAELAQALHKSSRSSAAALLAV